MKNWLTARSYSKVDAIWLMMFGSASYAGNFGLAFTAAIVGIFISALLDVS